MDLRGNVIAFGGRRMGEEGPKYLNSGDTPVFKKSNGLFALNLAKKSGKDSFILAEGYMDVIALHQAGFTNAVATLGTALTQQQAKLIADYAKKGKSAVHKTGFEVILFISTACLFSLSINNMYLSFMYSDALNDP